MKNTWIWIAFLSLAGARIAEAQGAPNVVWQDPTPGLLANTVQALAWSPVADQLAVGSDDRWFRMRQASDGALLYSVLEPQHSNGPGRILFSQDGSWTAVRNQSFGLSFRVQRAVDGALLGNVNATVQPNGIVTFAPDATLVANTGPGGTLSSWNYSELSLTQVTGSGYLKVSTTFGFSPDGLLQTAARKGQVTVQRRSDGAVLRFLRGGPVTMFSPDSSLLAVWSKSPTNEIVLWRTSDWHAQVRLRSPNSLEVVGGLRFTPDGQRIVSTGYLPYLDNAGLWQQHGFIRFWDVASGQMATLYDQGLDLAVTSEIAWSPDGSRFAYGLYDGSVAVALTP
jgi:WD40 repeat protein